MLREPTQSAVLECFGRLLESSQDAVALLDPEGIVLYSNPRFLALQSELGPKTWWTSQKPLLLPVFRELRAGLEQSRRVPASAAQVNRATIELLEGAPPRRLAATARVIPSMDDAGEEYILLLLHDPEREIRERLKTFRASHALTSMEARVLELFVIGHDLRQISIDLNVSIHTSRAHMKALLSKTGCRRQPELVRLLGSTPSGTLRVVI